MKWNCSCNKTNNRCTVKNYFMDKLCFLLTQNCLCFHIDDSTPYNISFHLHTLSTNFNSIGQNNGNITMNLFLVFYWKKCMGSSRWSGTAGHSQGHQWDRFWGHQSYFSCCTLWHPAWAWCRPHPSWIPTWSSALQPSCRATRSCAMRCPGARLQSTSTTFCHQWWLWDGSGSGQICPLQLCTDCIVLLELGTGEGGLLLTLSWRMVLVYWLFLSTRMSTSFWEEKKVCHQNVIGKQDERKVIFVCKKLIPIGTVTVYNHQSYTR